MVLIFCHRTKRGLQVDHVQAVGAVDGVHQRVDLRPRARAQVVVIMVVMVIMIMVKLLIEVMSMVMVVMMMVVMMVGIITRVIAVVEHHSSGRLEKNGSQ